MISELTNALVAISFWKLLLLGIFCIIALGILFLITTVLSPNPPWGSGGSPFHKKETKTIIHSGPMAVSPHAMGFGVFFIGLGVCILAAMFGFGDTSFWTIVSIVMLCGGMGLIVSYVIGSKGVIPHDEGGEMYDE